MSAAASREAGSRRPSIALARRACACSWRPSRCSTPAQAVVSRTRNATDSAGTSPMLSSSAEWPSANCPVATSALARERSSSTRCLGRRGLGQEPERVSKPGRGARGRALCGGLARLTESRDGGRVALPRRALDMMSALYRRCAARGERLGASLVRAQSPAAGRRLVDRPSNERMPEAKAARHLGLANEVELQQLVQGLERRRLGGRRGGRGQLGLERVAGYRCPLEHQPCAVREESELLGQRGGNRGRHVEIRRRELRNACRGLESERSGELLEIERVAAALLVESGCSGAVDRFTEELSRLAARQSADLDADEASPRGALARARRRRAPAPDEVGQPARRARPRPAAGAAARRAVRRMRSRPSGGRRARARAAAVAVSRSSSSRTARWLR